MVLLPMTPECSRLSLFTFGIIQYCIRELCYEGETGPKTQHEVAKVDSVRLPCWRACGEKKTPSFKVGLSGGIH